MRRSLPARNGHADEHLPDDVGIAAETCAPVRMAQDQHRLGARIVVSIDERASMLRMDADDFEEVCRDHHGRNPIVLAAVQEVE